METEIKYKQFCPICGAEVKVILRYPNYVCRRCAGKASSAGGRLLSFYNEDFGGGFLAYYRDTGESFNSHTCFIEGVRCRADEAHFGGIVIEKM